MNTKTLASAFDVKKREASSALLSVLTKDHGGFIQKYEDVQALQIFSMGNGGCTFDDYLMLQALQDLRRDSVC